MRRSQIAWLFIALLAAAGCKNSRSELVEAELRTKDRELREARGELLRCETMNEALENTLRAQKCAQPVMRPSAGYLSQVKDIQLGRGTGGLDENCVPGDIGIQVVVVPRDVDGSPIKAPGTLTVSAVEINPEGLKTPLSTWEISALQLRRSWKSGLFSTGYFVALPWQKLPTTEKLRIVATFHPLDGGAFEAERDIVIHPIAQMIPVRPTPGAAVIGPPLPATGGPALPPNIPVGPPPRPAGNPPPPGTPSQSKRWPTESLNELRVPGPAGP
jgi:hypothetical protein